MSLTKLSLGGNNDVIYKLFPPKEILVSDIPAGDGNIEKLFLRCRSHGQNLSTISGQATYVSLLCIISFKNCPQGTGGGGSKGIGGGGEGQQEGGECHTAYM
jgi:hypothetical protein